MKHLISKFIFAFELSIFITSCAIILKNPIVVHNDKASGDIYFHKQCEETNTREQTSRKQTAVSATKRLGGLDAIQIVNDELEQYDKQKDAQLKKVEQSLDSDSSRLEFLRVQLIDAKKQRTLYETIFKELQTDSTAAKFQVEQARTDWQDSEDKVVNLIAEIRALKVKLGVK